MSRRIQTVFLAMAVAAPTAAIAVADPDLADVPPHRHFIQQPDGDRSQVGPRVCDNPSVQRAFNQFHNNNHVSAGHGKTNPGLNNGQGGEIKARPC